MGVCNSGHEEIVWDGTGKCPMCTLIDEVTDLEGQIEDLTDERDAAIEELKELQDTEK